MVVLPPNIGELGYDLGLIEEMNSEVLYPTFNKKQNPKGQIRILYSLSNLEMNCEIKRGIIGK